MGCNDLPILMIGYDGDGYKLGYSVIVLNEDEDGIGMMWEEEGLTLGETVRWGERMSIL